MDHSTLVHVLQTPPGIGFPQEEIIYVETPQPEITSIQADIPPSEPYDHPTETVPSIQTSNFQEVPVEQVICPLTELCTVEVLTITMKDEDSEVNQITIAESLASSLRFCCKVCDKKVQNYSDFVAHAKQHKPNNTASKHPVSEATHPVSEATHPALEATHKAVEATHPAVVATHPAVVATHPAVVATHPAVEVMHPAVETTPVLTDAPDFENDHSIDSYNNDFDDDDSDSFETDMSHDLAEELISSASASQNKDMEVGELSQPGELSDGEVISEPQKIVCFTEMTCGLCDLHLNDESLWEEHVRCKHGQSSPFKCVVCGKECSSIASLRGHVTKIHGKFSQMVCENRWNKLRKNFPGVTQTPCKLCKGSGKSNLFVLKMSEVSYHEVGKGSRRDAGPRRNVTCEVCGKIFSHRYIRKHRRTHDPVKRFHCELCGKGFAVQHMLTHHLRQHDKDRPYKCRICGKSFPYSNKLTEHMENHGGKKAFTCNICNKQFCNNSGLKKHKATHTTEANYQCHICGVSVTLKLYLKRHYQRKHKFSKTDLQNLASLQD